MSLCDFLKSDLIGNQNLKLTGNNYAVSGTFVYADEDFVVVRGKDGNLHGIRSSMIEMIHTDESSELGLTPVDHSEYDLSKETVSTEAYKGVSTIERDKSSAHPAFKEFKPGDKIPLEELTSRDPKVASGWKRKEKDQSVNSALVQRVNDTFDEIIKAKRPEDEYSLVAFGKIIELQPGFLFGFIDDTKDGNRYYFNKNDIVDPNLTKITGKDIPVLYYRSQNHKGKAAKSIFLPSSVANALKLAAGLINKGEVYSAKQVVTNVLEIYPENASALRFKEAVSKKGGTGIADEGKVYDESEFSEMFRFFKEGKRLMSQKDYRGAIQSFQTALDNGYKPEACIKEIAQAYIGLHSRAAEKQEKEKIAKEGISFMNEYRAQLSKDLSTLFTLENFFFALGDYRDHIEVVEEVIAECGRNDDIPQYAFYLNKAAQSYMRLGEYNKALDAVMDGLEASPTHPQLQKTQFMLMEEMSKGVNSEESVQKLEDDETAEE